MFAWIRWQPAPTQALLAPGVPFAFWVWPPVSGTVWWLWLLYLRLVARSRSVPPRPGLQGEG